MRPYYQGKIEQCEIMLAEKLQNLHRLEAQRNELNSKGAGHPAASPPDPRCRSIATATALSPSLNAYNLMPRCTARPRGVQTGRESFGAAGPRVL